MKKYVILLLIVLLGLAWFSAASDMVNDPIKAKEHIEKAEELVEKEIYVDAVTEYESALQYEPGNEELYMKIADAYLKSGDSREFISICEDTAEKYQENTQAMDTLMNYYVENNDEDKAVKYLKDFLEEYPDNENAQKWFTKLEGSYTELYCRYDEMSEIVNDSMVVLDEDLYGLTDALGNEIVSCEYRQMYPFSEEGFALAMTEDGRWVYIDEDGQIRKAPDKDYENLGMYTEDGTVAEKDGQYGYLDEEMEPVGKFQWDNLTGIKNGIGAGEKNGKWALVNKKGKEKGEDSYEDVITDLYGFCSSQKRIFVKKDGVYHLINTKGKEEGDLTFEDARAFTEDGYAAVCKDGKWGFVNSDGELVIDYTYEEAESFQNGFASVAVDGKWGYINEEGTMVIQPEFLKATHISEKGTAAVMTEQQGEAVWKLLQLNLFQ